MKNRELKDRLRLIIDEKFKGNESLLAKEAEISVQTLNKYTKRGSVPNGYILLRLAKAAGVSMEWLLTGEPISSWDFYSREEREYIDTLVEVLRYKDENNKNLIKSALDVAKGSPSVVKKPEEVKIAVGDIPNTLCYKCGKPSHGRREGDCRCED